jgi:hypothetical protein
VVGGWKGAVGRERLVLTLERSHAHAHALTHDERTHVLVVDGRLQKQAAKSSQFDAAAAAGVSGGAAVEKE